MWIYEKRLEFPINIKTPDANTAALIISQYGGPDGEAGASMRYMSQRYSIGDRQVAGVLTDIATEELAHLEMIATMVHQLTRNLTPEQIQNSAFAPYYVDHTLGVWPQAAGGIPFNACEFQVKGDPVCDLVEDMAAEQKARVVYDNLLRLIKDPDIVAPLRFLREREIVHFQRFGEGLRLAKDRLDEKKIAYDVCPGVSSFCGAASSLHAELTLPGVSQSVIITRMAGRTGVPERESFRSLAAHHATMAVFLSTGLLSQMEKELGVKLFEKNGHKITLTQFGEEFLSYAEKTLDVLDDGIASIKRSAMGNGTIRLGFVRPLGISYVPRMAAAFIKKNPKLDIDFTFHTDVTGRLLDDMQLGKYDLLFCSKPSEEYHFTAEPVMKQRLVLITPKGHPLAKKRKRSINLAETAGYSYVCFDKNSGIRSIFDEMLKRSDITVKVAYETEEDQVIAGLVANGFGIAVVPYMDILEKMSVEIFEIESPEYERSFYMVNDNSTYMSPAVETFRNFVIENTSVLTAL